MEALKFDFVVDENNLKLKEVFSNNIKLKEVYIDIYPNNPLQSFVTFMLLLRTSESNISVLNNENRLILKRNNRYNTYFLNILFSEIEECFYNTYDNNIDFVIKVKNIYYKITVLNY